jgi:hypothetical protein
MLSICVCVSPPPPNQRLIDCTNFYETWYITAPEPISIAYFINPSHQSVCLYVYPPIVARQQLGKNVTASTNTYAAIEELMDASFSMRSVVHQRKAGD